VTVPDGYAIYAVRPDWNDDGPAGEVTVRELVAATPEARARLWGFLLDQDLTTTIGWRHAPVDEPLWLMLSDPRAVRLTVVDGLWLRLVDVEAALGAREYVADPGVVLEVTDAFCPWNAGRYRLAGGGCERDDGAAPDLALDVSTLASTYLGATTLLSLASAGLVRELTPGAVARAAVGFGWAEQPWCPEAF
jgi:predicted acetyltransferase